LKFPERPKNRRSKLLAAEYAVTVHSVKATDCNGGVLLGEGLREPSTMRDPEPFPWLMRQLFRAKLVYVQFSSNEILGMPQKPT
jgi:hypothetical protein